ncbi:filamentous hemagglutinin N-terminal domain-containing protein [Adonisia turfae]|uniref:S-layer family protein n=1 Tax=Adonisia turfae CCMR0081 TaxID=2292702 RepID=A0A6M0RN14_9CYAN|nr:S-layer family protein [Adonisia turfae]NEZ57579.1 S-layer family protein [Adonisia turfae CCMR0081]
MVKQYNLGLWVASKLLACGLLSCQTAWAQVIPDGTTATPDPGSCAVSCTITGGTTDSTGTNLFHSFSEFSVPDGSTVTFDHDPALVNILARVVNGPLSMIEGTIRTDVTSDTNLFLINPQGIIFGPRGSLELGGSFVATTADAIQFGEQGSFSTTEINSDVVRLTVDPSALLFTQSAPQPIINQSTALNPTSLNFGLSIQENNSLLLVGGDVILEKSSPTNFSGGIITAPSGRVELGGVKGAATVGLDIDGGRISLSYPDDVPLANVILDRGRLNISNSFFSVDRSAGSLVIRANSISFINRSIIDSATSGPDNAGNILLYANQSVTFDDGGISVSTGGSGNGGNLIVLTDILSLDNNATLSVRTNGAGNAGEISLIANSIILSDSDIIAEAFGDPAPAGSAGKIEIQTGTLSLVNNSSISTQTFGPAIDTEAAGLINIDARESVSLANDGSSITSATKGQRNASNIIINTPELTIQDFASISAVGNLTDDGMPTEGDAGNIVINGANQVTLSNGFITTETNTLGRGGNITLNTDQLTANSGARITATATATAAATTQGGSVTLNIDQINLSGETTGILAETQGPANAGLITLGPNHNNNAVTVNFQDNANISAATSGSGDGGRVVALAPEGITLTGNGSLSTRSTGAGPAGDIDIQTNGQFRVQNGAEVEVSGEGTGNSGMLDVIAETVVLNDGKLLASVQAGEDGNINLEIEDALILRGDSLISAEAFNDANGGNVNITTPFIIALSPDGPNGNDIQAIARQGNGGRIAIQANTLFGIEENKATLGNRTNDIDASSEAGIDGEVIIETLQVDPDEGIDPLPSTLATPEISQGCQAGSNGQFIATGQGGLPSNPYEPLSSDGIQEDIYPAGQTIPQPVSTQQTDTTDTLIEAQGWNRDEQGNIVLLVTTPDTHSSCQVTLNGAF